MVLRELNRLVEARAEFAFESTVRDWDLELRELFFGSPRL
jgi:hypothetical protein